MKFSSKVEKCGQSPMRKSSTLCGGGQARGIKVYHLNIGQPDVQTPPAFFLKPSASSSSPCSNTLPPPVSPELIDAIKGLLR